MADYTIDTSSLGRLRSVNIYSSITGKYREITPQELLSFDSNNIPFETQAINYYQIAELAERANYRLENAKQDVDHRHGQLYNKFVSDPALREANNGKKPTDTMINAAIVSDDEYDQLIKIVNRISYEYKALNRLSKAFEQRKDLMQSISAQRRAMQVYGGSNSGGQ